MDKDKKKLALLILEKAGMKKKSMGEEDKSSDMEDSDGEDSEGGQKEAMSDFVDAVQSKDVDAALEAFNTLMELCKE